MKKLLLSVFAALAVVSASAELVTFQVLTPLETNTCYIAGAFNNWTQQQMTFLAADEATKAFTLEVEIENLDVLDPSKGDYGYKYCSGPAWAFEEKTASGAGVSNRKYTPDVPDIVEKWAAVYDPALVAGPAKIIITDLPFFSPGDIYAVGDFGANNPSFPSWTPGAETMKFIKQADGTYVLDVPGDILTASYKLTCGASWDFEEQQANGWGIDGNRNCIPGENRISVARWKKIAGGALFNVVTPKELTSCYIADPATLNFLTMNKDAVREGADTASFTLAITPEFFADKATYNYLYYSGKDVRYAEVNETHHTLTFAADIVINDIIENFKEIDSAIEAVQGVSFTVFANDHVISALFEGEALVRLYNTSGQLLQSQKANDQFRVEGLQKGIYLLQVNNEVAKVAVK